MTNMKTALSACQQVWWKDMFFNFEDRQVLCSRQVSDIFGHNPPPQRSFDQSVGISRDCIDEDVVQLANAAVKRSHIIVSGAQRNVEVNENSLPTHGDGKEPESARSGPSTLLSETKALTLEELLMYAESHYRNILCHTLRQVEAYCARTAVEYRRTLQRSWNKVGVLQFSRST